jgi:L-rhamnose-H+ transport protein
MASIIIFATLWGLTLKEWHGTSRRTKLLVSAGLFLLIGSTVVVGYGNYLKANQEIIKVVSTH